jgi:hypothetical protein
MTLTAAPALREPRARIDWWQGAASWQNLHLTAFILYPVLSVLWISLSDDRSGRIQRPFFVLLSPSAVSRAVVEHLRRRGRLVQRCLALPLALLARYGFRDQLLLQNRGDSLPLVIRLSSAR